MKCGRWRRKGRGLRRSGFVAPSRKAQGRDGCIRAAYLQLLRPRHPSAATGVTVIPVVRHQFREGYRALPSCPVLLVRVNGRSTSMVNQPLD
jgi:hypothetical protein